MKQKKIEKPRASKKVVSAPITKRASNMDALLRAPKLKLEVAR